MTYRAQDPRKERDKYSLNDADKNLVTEKKIGHYLRSLDKI